MLKECLEVFEKILRESGGKKVVDTYIPADGTYLIVDKDGNIKANVEIVKDKKTKEINRNQSGFEKVCFYDYQSQLISMNKPIDPKKVIHSNSYLSFFVKKDSIVSGKLTEAVIDGYYGILENPGEKKYKKSREAAKIYERFEEAEGKVNIEAVRKNASWIKTHIFQLEDVDLKRKDYLKIFFEAEDTEYEREGRRYFLPNIYNNNEYNAEINGVVYGMPDNNLGMNAKKPFLSIKSRKYPAPYLLDGDDVILQKQFFDYLMNLVSSGKYQVYVDTERKKISGYANGDAPDHVESGYYFRIRKGKTEAEIYDQDIIPGYQRKLAVPFCFQNYLGCEHEHKPEYKERYQIYDDRLAVGKVIDEVFFSKFLGNNYTVDAGDISIKDEVLKQNILFSRDAISDWVFKGTDNGIEKILDQVGLKMIKSSALQDYREKVFWQFNLRWSLRDYFSKEKGENMGEIITEIRNKVEMKVLSAETVPVENDREYYYCVGQLAGYLISLSKAKDKKQSLISPLLNAKMDEEIKRRLLQLYKKYNYSIPEGYKRVKNLLAMVEGYVPDGMVDQEMVILGYTCDNVIYKKEEK
ncbi:hypothetical protein H6B11_00930 [Mediterraneibacter glycyrrhizinilyticus]|nr:type I-B CRISPR-associated protein Cas8b/Csh1 [Mediterraneibacter glycyrrhizinilyticus]MBM6852730.1 hypothetical protein [Mediterraneibacter glycyrrhizinilyticus]